VADLETMLQRLLGARVRCVTESEKGLGAIWADPTQVEQVIVNLAVNGRDAMPSGGTLHISTRNASVMPGEPLASELAPGVYVLLTVRDTGVGMDAETLTRVFEPFFTTKPQGKGTGLGLATVWGIVKQSRGHVIVQSAPGGGTTVQCFFPTTDQPIRQVAASGQPPKLEGQETILVVEDEESILAAATTKLRSHGYDVIAAPDGATARAVVDTHSGPIHLVVSDGVLSDVRVPQLLERLRMARPETRILIMSGYAEESVYGESSVDPGVPFLAKPFTLHELAVRVRQVLDEVVPVRRPG
jgi:CheY-like chemotaxis protein